MPSDKPKIVIYTDENTIKKLDIIAMENNRSRANMSETIIKKYLEQYEEKNGKIKIGEINQNGENNTVQF